MRTCSICEQPINPKEWRSIIAITSMKFYKNYNKEITRTAGPSQRRRIVYCPDCTRWYIDVLNERLREVAPHRVDPEEVYLA